MKKALIYTLAVILTGSYLLNPFAGVSAIEALRINSITVVSTDTKATVTWETNRPATGRVEYGIITGNYPYRIDSNFRTEKQTVTLYGLFPETTYYFKITARDEFAEVYSYEQSFKTKEFSDSKIPEISRVSVVYTTGKSATIQWVTDEPATTEVEFAKEVDFNKTNQYNHRTADGKLVTVHDITLKNLNEATNYQFRVLSKDKDNNVATWYNMSFRTNDTNRADKDDLIIYDIKPTSENDPDITNTSAVISWRTNKLGSGKVVYGTSPDRLNKTVTSQSPRDFIFNLGIGNLTPNTTYYYRIEATDIFGRTVKSEGHSFRTKGTGNAVDVQPTVLGSSTDGLIVYLPFDEGTGTTAKDMSFNNNDGVLNQVKTPAWATGRFGKALQFGGYGQNVAVADTDQISLRKEVTMIAWITIDQFERYNKIISKEDSYEILLGPDDGSLRMALFPENARDWKWLNSPTTALTKNKWLLVAGTYDGQTMKLYVDGQLVAQENQPMTINDTTHPMYIGGNVVDNREWFIGGIDEVGVFNYALTEAEIQNVYQNGLAYYLDEVGIPTNDNPNAGSGNGQVLGSANDQPTYACNPDLGYTKIKALYKTTTSPDVWAIMENGQKHYITSPQSFEAYGCNWSAVKIVSPATLNSYPTTSLVRTVTNATVYHLYQRAEKKWLKLTIPSPTVFVSYSKNYWGNIVRVNEYDMAAYPDAKLIKTADNSRVYLIEGSTRKYIPTEAVFNKYHFEWFEVVTVNQMHLESYQDVGNLQ